VLVQPKLDGVTWALRIERGILWKSSRVTEVVPGVGVRNTAYVLTKLRLGTLATAWDSHST
jgi:hypothetical protein